MYKRKTRRATIFWRTEETSLMRQNVLVDICDSLVDVGSGVPIVVVYIAAGGDVNIDVVECYGIMVG